MIISVEDIFAQTFSLLSAVILTPSPPSSLSFPPFLSSSPSFFLLSFPRSLSFFSSFLSPPLFSRPFCSSLQLPWCQVLKSKRAQWKVSPSPTTVHSLLLQFIMWTSKKRIHVSAATCIQFPLIDSNGACSLVILLFTDKFRLSPDAPSWYVCHVLGSGPQYLLCVEMV